MGFASAYLEERALFPQSITEAADSKTGIIVVVPAFDEPGINNLLDSLAQCEEPHCKVEIIIVINAPADSPLRSLENNTLTLTNIESWKKENKNCFFRLFVFWVGEPPVSRWGVGLARKTGMDEAVRRFNSINQPDGVILNIDADCTVDSNYFIEICNKLLEARDRNACSIYFEHPLSGNGSDENIYKHITLYELHLRYYFQGLAYSGFPYVFHTIGSAIAVKALQYVKAGGMNRRQAGEDFYFIQKLVPAGGYFNLNSTTVYPSARVSERVPFGTGALMHKLSSDQSSTFLTYNIRAFKELRIFFGLTEDFFKSDIIGMGDQFSAIPQGIKLFLDKEEWIEKMKEVKDNTSGFISFQKRFFGWFNMFRIVKYLNFVHSDFFQKQPVEIAACQLLDTLGIRFESQDPRELLILFRSLEKTA
jgi:hypothetical protein